MKKPEDTIREALARSDDAAVEQGARLAFADASSSEHTLAWAAAVVYERRITAGFGLLQTFIDRFPDSLHLPRVYLAEVMAHAARFDAATDHARVYLRCAAERGALDDPSKGDILREGIGKAFLLLTAAYTELGARSYSARVLKRARDLQLGDRWDAAYRQEEARLAQERADPARLRTDEEWEAFFSRGEHAAEWFERCQRQGYPQLAKRILVLETNFRLRAEFTADDREMLMLVYRDESDTSLLA